MHATCQEEPITRSESLDGDAREGAPGRLWDVPSAASLPNADIVFVGGGGAGRGTTQQDGHGCGKMNCSKSSGHEPLSSCGRSIRTPND